MRIHKQLENAVKALCPDIDNSANESPQRKWTERALWKEMLTCVLSSQVRNEVAQVAANEILKNVYPWSQKTIEQLERELRAILIKPLQVKRNSIRYRFPNAKAAQIANAISRTSHSGIYISSVVYSNNSANDIRSTLVDLVPGLGYKQASMFLRNIGRAYDLAILDRHIFDYMNLLDIEQEVDKKALTKSKYLSTEKKLKKYAGYLGYTVGCVDWAIWIVMRTAKQEGYV
ncbi:MAG: hypothetical protein AB2665_20160 [Candidatus Thiodiazotropha sp.]